MEEKQNNKVIHYIWYGGNPLSELTKKCIASWKKYLPDFEIKEWNESNFDVNQCPFIKEAYEQKKWAFVADYTRFKVLEEYGGMYLDTDMEITKDVSEFLEKDLFMGVEDSKMINAAVVWVKEAHNPQIQDLVKIYESKKHFNETGDLYEESVPKVLTKYFSQFGFDGQKDEIQIFNDNKSWIYPMEYFYPKSYDYQNNRFTENSAMIHHFDATWISPMEKFKTKMKRQNMVWVVYVIDFFVWLKHKIKYFSSYKSVSVFLLMFTILMLAMLSITSVSNPDYSSSAIQVTCFSVLWAYVTTKLINIDINKYGDKLTNTNSDDGEYRKVKFNLSQLEAFQSREKKIFISQIILTIIVALLPILHMFTSTLNSAFGFIMLNIINTYFIYLGINTKFKFRILELVPLGIILAMNFVLYPTNGVLLSVLSFGYILYNMFKNNVVKKRKVAYVASYATSLLVLTVLSLLIPKINNFKALEFKMNLGQETQLSRTIDIDAVTQFNAGKSLFANNINSVAKSSFVFSNTFQLILGIVLTLLIVVISKDRKYLVFILLAFVNTIGIMGESQASFGLALVLNLLLILFLMHKGLQKIFDKE